MKKAVIIAVVFLMGSSSFAETIKLKSGEVYEGKIIERNKKYVTLGTGGAPMYLPVNQIVSVSAQEPAADKTHKPQSTASYEELTIAAANATASKDFALAEQKSLQAVQLDPQRSEAYYNLYALQFAQGKFDEAVKNYTKAVDLGFSVPPEVQAFMTGYKYQELTVDLPKRGNLPVKGSTGCSVKLITDVLVAFTQGAEKAENLLEVRPKFLQWENGFKDWKEQWVIVSKSGESVVTITFTMSPGGGTDFKIAS